jgi:hypothetical protein
VSPPADHREPRPGAVSGVDRTLTGCGNCGTQVTALSVTGYMWGENIGSVNLNCQHNGSCGGPAGMVAPGLRWLTGGCQMTMSALPTGAPSRLWALNGHEPAYLLIVAVVNCPARAGNGAPITVVD